LLTTELSPAETETPWPTRLGILISGRGSNCLAIARAIREGQLSGCEIGVVISNIPGAPGIEAAKSLGIPVVTLEGRGREQRDHEDAISALLRKFRVDLVCLAGYRRVLSASFIRQWKGRILNLQASLLPAFPGRGAAQQALDYGAQFTGCTVYFVDEQTDGGVIVLQRVIDIEETDTVQTLSEALMPEQHIAYTEAIQRVIGGQYEARGRRYVHKDLPRPEPVFEAADVPEEDAFNPSHGAETLQRPVGTGVR
jgi:phosphoribosylglycinamide formyltransferase 1